MSRKLHFPRKLFNDKFYDYVFNVWDRAVTLNLGSAGSSKSVHSQMKNVLRLLTKNQNILAVRETYASMKDSVFSEMKQAVSRMGLDSLFSCTVSPLCIECIPTRRMMIFRGLDKVDKIKSIVPKVGIINHVDWEEATESAEDDLNQLQFRSRGGGIKRSLDDITETMSKILSASDNVELLDIRREILKNLDLLNEKDGLSNGESKTMELRFNTVFDDHWIAKRFVFTGPNGKAIFELPMFNGTETWEERYRRSVYDTQELYILHSTHWDNQFLTKEDNLKYESYRFINEYYYTVYAQGLWGSLRDSIFTNFKLCRMTGEFISNIPMVYVGLDFGFEPDPCAIIRVGINEAKREIYIIDEQTETRLDMDGIVTFVDSFCYENETVWADCSEKMEIHTITKTLGKYGIQARPVSKFHGGGKGGFKLSCIMQLRSYTIYINENCVQFAREIRNYGWKKDSNGNTLHEPEDGSDHLIDAFFYSLNTVLKARARTKVH